MKLTFVKPKENIYSCGPEELLFYGLWLEGIYIGERKKKEFSIKWNNVYGFWNITLYPIQGNTGNPIAQYKEFENWLKENNYKHKIWKNSMYKWENNICIDGLNFWVYPKEIK